MDIRLFICCNPDTITHLATELVTHLILEIITNAFAKEIRLFVGLIWKLCLMNMNF